MSIILRDYQKECVHKMETEIGGRFSIKLPTGSGKTVIFSNYISRQQHQHTLILVHRDELVKQTIEKLKSYGIKFNIEKASNMSSPAEISKLNEKLRNKRTTSEQRKKHYIDRKEFLIKDLENTKIKLAQYEEENAKAGKPVRPTTRLLQRMKNYPINIKYYDRLIKKESEIGDEKLETNIVVASVQSMKGGRLTKWDRDSFDCLIFDEGHHLTARSWKAIDRHFLSKKTFAFSATVDSKEIMFKSLFTIEMTDLIAKGVLAVPTHIMLPVGDDYVGSTANFLKDNQSEKALVYMRSVKESHQLKGLLDTMKIKSHCLDAKTENDQRKMIIEDFKSSKHCILINYQILTEGFDAPDASMIIIRPTKERDSYVQIMGRGLRKTDVKSGVKIVDLISGDEQVLLTDILGVHRKAPLPEFRRGGTPYKKILGDKIKITKYAKKYAKGTVYGSSNFYSEAETVRKVLAESIKEGLMLKPCKQIDPSEVKTEKMTSLETKRFIAVTKLRKNFMLNPFLRSLFYNSKKRPLSESQCDWAIKLCNEIEAELEGAS